MLVYRIENDIGRGPYRKEHNGDGKDCNVNLEKISTWESKNHPIPWDDGIRMNTDTDVCGFQSLNQLLSWFHIDNYVEKLEKDNFFISIYKVKKKFVKIGRKQVCFARNRAWLVGYVNKG